MTTVHIKTGHRLNERRAAAARPTPQARSPIFLPAQNHARPRSHDVQKW